MAVGPRKTDDAPESLNREQEDEGQAQDVAEDARHPGGGLGESRPSPGDPYAITPDDRPDLVDTMNRMVRTGRIDNDAFAGEPVHDDEEDIIGDTEGDAGDDPLDHVPDPGEDPLSGIVGADEFPDDSGEMDER